MLSISTQKILSVLRMNLNYSLGGSNDYCLNSSFHKFTGDTPVFALHGFDKVQPFDIIAATPQRPNPSTTFVAEKFRITQQIHQRFRDSLEKTTLDFTNQANKTSKPLKLKPGDLVMTRDLSPTGDTPKLDPTFWVLLHLTDSKYRIRHLDTGDV